MDAVRRLLPRAAGAWLAACLASSAPAAALAIETTVRVSVDDNGLQGDRSSRSPELSADGRFVAFYSDAGNLVPGDTNSTRDVFVYDRQAKTVQRVSVSSAGVEGNGPSGFAGGAASCPRTEISANGRWVAFESAASNLVVGDTNALSDVFVHDRLTGQTERVSLDAGGAQLGGFSASASISRDGRFVAFVTASPAVPEDGNQRFDVFVRDRVAATTERVSVGSGGIEADGSSNCPSISGNGRHVAFYSLATNLVAGDSNGLVDVFVHDRSSHVTQRASVGAGGSEADGTSFAPRISGNGRMVAFVSNATNLVAGDSNGASDVFVRDLQSALTLRASVAVNGAQASAGADASVGIDDAGRQVTFRSASPDLVAGDTNALPDSFVKDLLTGMIRRTSLAHNGAQMQAPDGALRVAISGNGRVAAFDATSGDLVPDDSNRVRDVFVRELPTFAYEYAAKVVCGTQNVAADLRLAPGLYATTVNIHSPRAGVELFKKLALTSPPGGQHPGQVFPIAQHVLSYDEALGVDCNDIRREVFGGRFPAPFIEGFLVVQSTDSLDVTAVHSSAAIDARGSPTAHSSIDVQRVEERHKLAKLDVSKSARYFCNAEPVVTECTVVAALYTVVVRNDGDVPAVNAVLDDTVSRTDGVPLAVVLAAPHEVPPGAVFSVVGPASIRVDLGELGAGQEVQVRFWALTVIGPGHQPDALINRAEVSAKNADVQAAAVIVQSFD